VSTVVARSDRLPKRLGWLGLLIGVTGLVSVVPPLNDATVAFGLLQIIWFAWLGVFLLKSNTTASSTQSAAVDIRDLHLTENTR
jgi:hypothetical protein